MKHQGFVIALFGLFALLASCVQTRGELEAAAVTQRLYVATNGNDTNPGTFAQPFRTIQKCALQATPGTVCFIRAGTYRETVRPARSGQVGLPIVFEAYGSERVVVSGADPVSAWTADTGSVYKAPITWNLGAGNNQVFVNGKMMPEARYPNASSNPFEPWRGKFVSPRGSGVTYTVSASSVPSNLAGANINFIPGPEWVVETGKITESTASSFTFTSPGGQLAEPVDFNPSLYAPRPGNPYFIWGKRSLLDSAGEWFLEAGTSSTGQLYLWSPTGANPATQTVEVKRRLYAFDLTDRSYINLLRLHIFAATITTGDVTQNPNNATSQYVVLYDIHSRYPSHFTSVTPGDSWNKGMRDSGIILYGQNHRLENSSVAFSAGNGVTLAGSNHRIKNNIIHDVNYTVTDTSAITAGFYDYSSRAHILQNNTLYDTGRSVIVHRNTQALKILNNHLYYAGLLGNDLGMTYTFQADGGGTEIAYNLLHDNFAPSESMGIYLDNGSRNFVVHHNIVYNVRSALNLNLPTLNNKVYNNTLIGFAESVNSGAGRVSQCDATGTELINNIFNAQFSLGYVFDGTQCPNASATPRFENNLVQTTNPRFTDILSANFTLAANSPAINKGRVLAPYTNGFTGNAPDIGALESGIAPFSTGATITEPCAYGDTCPRPAQPRYGVLAEYFADQTLTSLRSRRIEGSLAFGYYGETDVPSGSFLPSGANYSARWTGYLKAPVTGTYTFTLTADDGARLWLNNVQRVNRWEYIDPPTNTFSVSLQAGQSYPIRMEMYQGSGGAAAILEWAYPGQPKQLIPVRHLTIDKP